MRNRIERWLWRLTRRSHAPVVTVTLYGVRSGKIAPLLEQSFPGYPPACEWQEVLVTPDVVWQYRVVVNYPKVKHA